MNGHFQHRRGLEKDLPKLRAAEIGFATDSEKVFIGNGKAGNVEIATAKRVRALLESKVSTVNGISPNANGNVVISVTQGPKGDQGERGPQGPKGDSGEALVRKQKDIEQDYGLLSEYESIDKSIDSIHLKPFTDKSVVVVNPVGMIPAGLVYCAWVSDVANGIVTVRLTNATNQAVFAGAIRFQVVHIN